LLKLLKTGAVRATANRRLALVEFLANETSFNYIADTTLAVRTSASNR
jgi:hypothetical protein